MADEQKLPSMLAFDRKLETSDALMFSGKWEDQEGIEDQENWVKIPITKRYNRSTQSAHGIKAEKKAKPNPASSGSDDANLPKDHDTLKVSFSVRIVGNLGQPFGCNDPKFSKAIKEKTDKFKDGPGMTELALRYAYNLANGRFLWRNRVGAEKIKIVVNYIVKKDDEKDEPQRLCFNPYKFSLSGFDDESRGDKDLQTLASTIRKALTDDEQSHVLLEVDAFVKLGSLQHVFPSQKMNVDKKDKELFELEGCAAMHNVKIGNAIRTIDTWYREYETQCHPIAIEPFGAVTQIGRAFREKQDDLYTLMLEWVYSSDELDQDKQMFIVGNLIRGGVFSGASK